MPTLEDSEELDLWSSANLEAQWRPVDTETPSSEFSSETFGLVQQAQAEHQRLAATQINKKKSKPEMVMVKMCAVLIAVLIGIYGYVNMPTNLRTIFGIAQGQKEVSKGRPKARKWKRTH